MPNRNKYQDQQRSNEPYNARSEYGRRRHSSSPGPSRYDRGGDYYESGRSPYESRVPDRFTGEDFGRGYSDHRGDRGNYPETFGGHGSSEGMYDRSRGYADRTDSESEFQNSGRNYGSRYGGGLNRDAYGREYPNRNDPPQGSYSNRGRFPESERGFYNEPGYHNEEDRGWWDKAADEVSSWMGDEEAARRREMDAGYGKFRGHGPKNYKRSDERIKEDINDRLTDHSHLDASDIEVEVNEGDVVLSGTVKNRSAKRMAEDIAESVSSVKNVENRLRVDKATWVAGVGDINAAGNRTTFPDISETKSMSKNA